MDTAAQLIASRVVEATSTDRLASIADKLASGGSNHCVVLDADRRQFLGIVRLGDVARTSNPGNRILGDLISKIAPVTVGADEPAAQVLSLFERNELGEAVVFSAEGNYLGLITAESALRWAASTLRAADKTASEAKTQLAAQTRTGTAFLAAISHELRTPLNPVLMIASDRSQAQDLPEIVRRDFQQIAKQVQIEANLIEDLLEVTKILSGNISLDRNFASIHRLLEQAILRQGPLLRAKELSVDKEWLAANDSASVDERRLGQVFTNVLNNAIKFSTPRGRIRIATRSSTAEGTLTIEIQDNGVGMTDEELDRLFVPFSPLDKGEKGSPYHYSGIGLGMPVARNLIQIHNGTIEAQSEGRGRGTTIRITLRQAETPI